MTAIKSSFDNPLLANVKNDLLEATDKEVLNLLDVFN